MADRTYAGRLWYGRDQSFSKIYIFTANNSFVAYMKDFDGYQTVRISRLSLKRLRMYMETSMMLFIFLYLDPLGGLLPLPVPPPLERRAEYKDCDQNHNPSIIRVPGCFPTRWPHAIKHHSKVDLNQPTDQDCIPPKAMHPRRDDQTKTGSVNARDVKRVEDENADTDLKDHSRNEDNTEFSMHRSRDWMRTLG